MYSFFFKDIFTYFYILLRYFSRHFTEFEIKILTFLYNILMFKVQRNKVRFYIIISVTIIRKDSLKQRKTFFNLPIALRETLQAEYYNETRCTRNRRFQRHARRSFRVSRHKSPLDRSSGREDSISVRRNVSKPRGKSDGRGGSYKSVTIKLQSKPAVNLLFVSNRTAVYRS